MALYNVPTTATTTVMALSKINESSMASLNTTSKLNLELMRGDPCMNVEYIPGIVSNETSRGLNEFYHKYGSVHGYIAIAVCCFGILSNTANIIVLTRKNMASSSNTILMWLAVSDLLTMLSYLPFAYHFFITEPGDPKVSPFSTPDFAWLLFLLFHANFSIVCHTVAIWLTIALAIFRYIYICKPTSGAYYCSQRRARFVVILVTILTIIVCVPNFGVNYYRYEPGQPIAGADGTLNDSTMSNVTGPGLYYPTIRAFSASDAILVDVNNWLQAILIKLLPCFMLTTLTLLLVHAMHKAYRKRLKLKSQGRVSESDRHSEHNRTTRMLLAVVVLFTLTELPQGILTLMNIFVDCFTSVVYYKLGDLLDIVALINNAINFVLYCIMSSQFRNTFWQIFCPAKHRLHRPKWLRFRPTKGNASNKNSIEMSEDNGSARYTKNNNASGNALTSNGSVRAETTDPRAPLTASPHSNKEQEKLVEPLETEFPVTMSNGHHGDASDGGAAEEIQDDGDRQPLSPERV
ncbi:FMRFamide receptor [Elysia marginata]|uniref:FMRFamide receptor n=1 Tax=Elysia marginata TaxID=1093978 RepID=A0AAV4EZ71_9GAST|nr:FMRFamide receptor [Elysia marginata]